MVTLELKELFWQRLVAFVLNKKSSFFPLFFQFFLSLQSSCTLVECRDPYHYFTIAAIPRIFDLNINDDIEVGWQREVSFV